MINLMNRMQRLAHSLVVCGFPSNERPVRQCHGRGRSFTCVALSAALALLASIPVRAGVVPWGDSSLGQAAVPSDLTDAIAIAAGGGHNVAVKPDGTVVAWGYNPYGQTNVPPGLSEVVAVAAAYDHNLALKSDRTVVAWGRNYEGQTNVPAGLSDVRAVAANGYWSLALKGDGTVVAWGANDYGQTNVPPGLDRVVAISAGVWHGLAVKSDGTVVAWGRNDSGQRNVPADLSGVMAVAGGGEFSLALKNDGTVVAWGAYNYGQTNLPAALSGVTVTAIAAGFGHGLALKADRTVVGWGWNAWGQATVPAGLTNVVAIAAGYPHSLALVRLNDDRPLTITCPPDAVLQGTNCLCDTNPSHTGMATATGGNGIVTVSFLDSESGACPKVIRRTWTATDDRGQTNSCVQTITCSSAEDEPPQITCPPDVILPCADCETEPEKTGKPEATDDSGTVQVSHEDWVRGVCPKVVTRRWTATDNASQSATCVQTITCLPPSLVTDSSRCLFDRDPATPVSDFRLIFTQDPQNWPCYRLTASNPGQFMYNVFYTGTPGESASFEVTLPYPFVTQGANPVHAYDWVYVSGEEGRQCLMPGNAFFVSPDQVTLTNYGTPPQAATKLKVTLTVPDSGVVFLAVHLDYGLKRQSGYTKNTAGDGVDCATGTQVLIPNHGSYEFTVSGAQNGTALIQNINVFKKNPGVAGLVLTRNSSEPVSGTLVALTSPRGTRVGSSTTDEDGFYLIAYRHKGKAATYSLSIVTPTGYKETKAVTLKANAFVDVGFKVP